MRQSASQSVIINELNAQKNVGWNFWFFGCLAFAHKVHRIFLPFSYGTEFHKIFVDWLEIQFSLCSPWFLLRSTKGILKFYRRCVFICWQCLCVWVSGWGCVWVMCMRIIYTQHTQLFETVSFPIELRQSANVRIDSCAFGSLTQFGMEFRLLAL